MRPGAKTNAIPSGTITHSQFKSTTSTTAINSGFILKLLENSFNTNFPANARLILSGSGRYSFFVSDAAMTNILLDAGNVLSLSLVGTVFSGSEQLVNTTTNGASFISGTDAET